MANISTIVCRRYGILRSYMFAKGGREASKKQRKKKMGKWVSKWLGESTWWINIVGIVNWQRCGRESPTEAASESVIFKSKITFDYRLWFRLFFHRKRSIWSQKCCKSQANTIGISAGGKWEIKIRDFGDGSGIFFAKDFFFFVEAVVLKQGAIWYIIGWVCDWYTLPTIFDG